MFKCGVCLVGDTLTGLYNASEALRLSSTLFSSSSIHTKAASQSQAQPSALSETNTPALTAPAGVSELSSNPHSPSQAHGSPQHSSAQAVAADSRGAVHDDSAQTADLVWEHGQAGVSMSRDGMGYWQVAWLYLTSLLKLGEVYETVGSHEDALHAFKEGQELVSICSHITWAA